MYDIIGNVTDEKNAPISGVLVDDGKKSTTTDANGYYEMKTDMKSIKFTKNGFKPQAFNLTVYKYNPMVNIDAKLSADIPQTTNQPVENEQKKMDEPKKSSAPKIIIWSLVGIALIATSIIIYKKVKK